MMNRTYRGSPVMTLMVTCLGFFMVLLDASIVNLALPTIQADLHARLSDLQWVVDAYTLPFAVLLLTAGTLSDRYGRKRFFLAGLVLFLLGSTLCGFANTLEWFFIGRVIQGVGGTALSPGSLSVLVAAFPEPRARMQAIGIWSGISGLALAAGPLVGGVLIQLFSWPAIFFVNLPVGLVALALGWPLLAESRNPTRQRIDLPGQFLVIAALTCLITALIEGSSQGWTSTLILSLFIGSAVGFAAFFLVEARVREPLHPLGLFRSRAFSVANVGGLVAGFALLGTVFFVSQYFQAVQGYTALQSGLRTLPFTMGIFLVAPFAGQLAAQMTPRLPIALGALLTGISLFLLTRLEPASSYAAIWWELGMGGIGFGFMLSPLTAAVLSATPPTRAGLGSSMINTSRQVGSTLGVAVLGGSRRAAVLWQHCVPAHTVGRSRLDQYNDCQQDCWRWRAGQPDPPCWAASALSGSAAPGHRPGVRGRAAWVVSHFRYSSICCRLAGHILAPAEAACEEYEDEQRGSQYACGGSQRHAAKCCS